MLAAYCKFRREKPEKPKLDTLLAAALEAVHGQLARREDVSIEFAPESLGGGPIRHMMCRIPGNIRIEFIGA